MSKIAIITDQHFGARNDSINFLDYYEKFYTNVFFPKLNEERITKLLILGDTFDRRKYVNFYSLKRAKEMFFNELQHRGIDTYMLVGNHDTTYKNTNEVNSPDLLIGNEYDHIEIISYPTTINLYGTNIAMIPWICADNYQVSMHEIKNTEAEICCGHFEIDGFAMYKGMPSSEGLSRSLFKKFDMTFSGHYHHKSNADGIYYLGNPYPLTWQDYGDDRGFHILDLSTRELEFIKNPYEMFVRVVYDDKKDTIKNIASMDMKPYEGKYVKVVVVNKTNPYMFDVFMNNMYQVNPIDITIVEDFSDLTEGIDETMVDQAEDTLAILNTFVDTLKDDNYDSSKLKSILKELYVEALTLEQT